MGLLPLPISHGLFPIAVALECLFKEKLFSMMADMMGDMQHVRQRRTTLRNNKK